ncbi:MAG: transposase, partial [Planctomycetes bacterium]|nr:transposase [Planctomycetota bacterium]
MAKSQRKTAKRARRTFTLDFKQQAVQMMADGYSASSVSDNLGIGNTNLLYRWKT